MWHCVCTCIHLFLQNAYILPYCVDIFWSYVILTAFWTETRFHRSSAILELVLADNLELSWVPKCSKWFQAFLAMCPWKQVCWACGYVLTGAHQSPAKPIQDMHEVPAWDAKGCPFTSILTGPDAKLTRICSTVLFAATFVMFQACVLVTVYLRSSKHKVSPCSLPTDSRHLFYLVLSCFQMFPTNINKISRFFVFTGALPVRRLIIVWIPSSQARWLGIGIKDLVRPDVGQVILLRLREWPLTRIWMHNWVIDLLIACLVERMKEWMNLWINTWLIYIYVCVHVITCVRVNPLWTFFSGVPWVAPRRLSLSIKLRSTRNCENVDLST